MLCLITRGCAANKGSERQESGGVLMTKWPGDEHDWTDRITLSILLVLLIACMGLWVITVPLSNFPFSAVMKGLLVAGVTGYTLFRGLKWLSRWSRLAAVAVLLSIIGVIVFLWPAACVVRSEKWGAPVRHYCRCHGLTVKSWDQNFSHPRSITYCFGWEIEDMWEEQLSWPTLN